jgi:predicted nucleic acid-binding protein
MRLPNSPPERDVSLVADAGFWINLAAIERPEELLHALSKPVIVPDVTLEELKRAGRRSALVVETLLSSGHARLETLPPSALPGYAALVAGPAAETLDDGEAATVALANAIGGVAIIDEKKAHRLSPLHFPELRLIYSIEILLSPAVEEAMGRIRVRDAVFAALSISRMRVPSELADSVIEVIGRDRARLCHSLLNHRDTPNKIDAGSPPTAETRL